MIEQEVLGCDESKCVSTGWSHLYQDSFTCYGDDGAVHPRMCADGYVPFVVVDDGQPQEGYASDIGQASELSYFTCCPSLHQTIKTPGIRRHCSDPMVIMMDTRDATTCANEEDGRIFARPMTPRVAPGETHDSSTNAVLCCDYDSGVNVTEAEPAEFLDDAECVPYQNDSYEPAIAKSTIGAIGVIFCDFDDGVFSHARPMGNQSVSAAVANGRYQCCKTGPGLPPLVQDSAFRITVYPTLVLFYLAALASAMVALGLILPLANSSSRAERSSQRSGASTRRSAPPEYSSYNLYLVYLALLDLIYMGYTISVYQSYLDQTFDPTRRMSYAVNYQPRRMTILDDPLIFPYTACNLWINAIILYQIFLLLKSARKVRRIEQPSLRRVNFQMGSVCIFFAIPVAIVHVMDLDIWRFRPFLTAVGMAIPGFYVLGVSVWIWWMLPPSNGSSQVQKATRQLTLFFGRVVVIFLGIWFPRYVIIYYYPNWLMLVAQALLGIQPLVTTAAILTKSDVRSYMINLVTGGYCGIGSLLCQCSRTGKGSSPPTDDHCGDRSRSTTAQPSSMVSSSMSQAT